MASPARPDSPKAPDWRPTAKLVFGKPEDCARHGPRSDAETLVQVVCHAADFDIDLQIEPEFEAAGMALVGQVVNRTASEPVAGAAVRLMARKRLLATTQTNSSGEFCLMAGLQTGLKLYIEIESADLRVGIPLDRLTEEFRL